MAKLIFISTLGIVQKCHRSISYVFRNLLNLEFKAVHDLSPTDYSKSTRAMAGVGDTPLLYDSK